MKRDVQNFLGFFAHLASCRKIYSLAG